MTLRQAVDTALKQSPEIALARLDEESAKQAVRQAKDPFTPRIAVGSGLAYTSGFPMSMEGAAPSILQAAATQYLFNKPQSYAIAQAKENARGAAIGTAAAKDVVAYRVAELFLDAERAGRVAALARKEIASAETVQASVRSQAQEGRVLPVEAKRADLAVLQARQLAEGLEADQEAAETALAVALGLTADDRVRPAAETRAPPPLPASEDAAVEDALAASKRIRQLQSQIAAKGLEIRGARAARWPRADLVAQYGLFAKFNNYEDFFRRFQRHNGEIGVSFQLPLLPGPGVSAATARTEAEIARLRVEMNNTRNRITAATRQAYRAVRRAELAGDVARLDLEVAREQLSVLLAQTQEGRATLAQVEQARLNETGKWLAFYSAQYALERARWTLLSQTGDLLAALK